MHSPEKIKSLVSEHGSPLMLLDCDVVRQQYHALQQALPNVDLHFALKPLPNLSVVQVLKNEGAFFDVASSGEIDLVKKAGVLPEKTIHTHPIKRNSDIQHALDYGCNTFIVDNLNELEKFIDFKEHVTILVRLSFRNAQAVSDLSKKFGCLPEDGLKIIQCAFNLGIHVEGISFHVGSQSVNPDAYVNAINKSAEVFKEVDALTLPPLTVLDIGGGFPVRYTQDVMGVETFCEPIRNALAQFPNDVRFIAEPGRFIVASAVTSISSVMGQAERYGKNWYYLDDGLYGSFSGIIFEDVKYPLEALDNNGEKFECVLAGPTCDSIDVISESILLPKMDNGDLVVAHVMGAYTRATATDFNFFERAKIIVFNKKY